MDSATAIEMRARAGALLGQGRFAEAWPLYEARRHTPGTSTLAPPADYPEWQGEDLAGKHIMVVAEQGFGDQMMFGRWLGALAARAAKVEILCHPSIWTIFGTAGYGGHPYFTNRPAPRADYWVLFGSLPLRLGLPEPPTPVYLPLQGRGGGIGVKTAGNPAQVNDRNRSLTGADADALLSLGRDLEPTASGAPNFLATAEIMAGLDLVITVDTATAHLAGIMGKPCWVLLGYGNQDWRYAGDDNRSRWYPDFRLLRQSAPGDWAGVLDQVRRDLGR